MISPKLSMRAISREKAGALSAAAGVAAAAALLAWHIIIAETAMSQAGRLAAASAAPYEAWLTGPARPAVPAPPLPVSPSHPEYLRLMLPGADFAVSETNTPLLKPSADAVLGFRRGYAPSGALPAAVIALLSGAPDVVRPVFTRVVAAPLDVRPGGRVLQGPPFMAALAAMPAGGKPLLASQRIVRGAFPPPDSAELEATFNEKIFEDRRIPAPALGDVIPVMARGGALRLRVAGIFRADTLVPQFPSVYITPAAMERLSALERVAPGPRRAAPRAAAAPLPPTLALLTPAPGARLADVEALLERAPESFYCQYVTRAALAARYRTDTAANVRRQLPLSLSLAFITAVFMIATTLTAGVSSQRRRIAVLRCNGMTRGGVARLVLCETAILGASGWALGFIAAAVLAQLFLLAEASPELPRCILLTWRAPLITAAVSLAAAMASSVAPAIHACRVRPLEALGGGSADARRVGVRRTLCGLALLCPVVALSLPSHIAPGARLWLMLCAGLPAFAAGAVLCLHPLMRAVEVLLTRPVGALIGLDHRILSRRLSRAPGRAAGTVLTLALGLGAFMAIHIWGGSLMSYYVPSPEWPDAIVSILPGGADMREYAAVRKTEGVDGVATPIEATQFPLSKTTLDGIAARGLPLPRSDLMLVFGADPAVAFGGAEPLARFRFTEGDAASAAAALMRTNACIIPVMFSRLSGLHLGDSVELGGKTLSIAGVADVNWHLVTSRANLRTRIGRLGGAAGPASARAAPPGRIGGGPPKPTLSMLFVSERTAREMTGNTDKVYFLWLNLAPGLSELHPLQAAVRLDAAFNAAFDKARAQIAADDALNGSAAAPPPPVFSEANSLQVHYRDEISTGTLAHGSEILGTMARIPFWSLIVTSTGIAALLIASARASKRETDAMRAAGMTRGQLARLFFGEALFVIVCALLLSLVCGVLLGWSFTAVTREQMGGGIGARIVVPWLLILRGSGFMLLLSMLMAAAPLAKITR